jgi:hypothetical protein
MATRFQVVIARRQFVIRTIWALHKVACTTQNTSTVVDHETLSIVRIWAVTGCTGYHALKQNQSCRKVEHWAKHLVACCIVSVNYTYDMTTWMRTTIRAINIFMAGDTQMKVVLPQVKWPQRCKPFYWSLRQLPARHKWKDIIAAWSSLPPLF